MLHQNTGANCDNVQKKKLVYPESQNNFMLHATLKKKSDKKERKIL